MHLLRNFFLFSVFPPLSSLVLLLTPVILSLLPFSSVGFMLCCDTIDSCAFDFTSRDRDIKSQSHNICPCANIQLSGSISRETKTPVESTAPTKTPALSSHCGETVCFGSCRAYMLAQVAPLSKCSSPHVNRSDPGDTGPLGWSFSI